MAKRVNEQSNNDMSQELTDKLGTTVNYIDEWEDTENDTYYKAYELPEIDDEGLLSLGIYNNDTQFQFYYDATPIPVPNVNTKAEAEDMMQALNPYPVSLEYLKPELLDWIKRWMEPEPDEDEMDFDEVLTYMKD
jgi:hypothetical protein